jgi:hypothetical protein
MTGDFGAVDHFDFDRVQGWKPYPRWAALHLAIDRLDEDLDWSDDLSLDHRRCRRLRGRMAGNRGKPEGDEKPQRRAGRAIEASVPEGSSDVRYEHNHFLRCLVQTLRSQVLIRSAASCSPWHWIQVCRQLPDERKGSAKRKIGRASPGGRS